MSRINNKYNKKFKLEVVKMCLDGGGSTTVAKQMGVKNKSQVKDWVKKYRILGETAFDEENRGRAKKTGAHIGRPKTNFSSLEEENKYLRMQVEFLKKLQALQKIKK